MSAGPRFHIVIPFYYGRSTAAGKKFGAPPARKEQYLRATIAALQKRFSNPAIHVMVCNAQSESIARTLWSDITLIDCAPSALPLAGISHFKEHIAPGLPCDDFFMFNEDDQVLYLSQSVLDDIVAGTAPCIFSPHRWSRLFLFFRIKRRPIYKLNAVRGVIDNYNRRRSQRRTIRLGHVWDVQENRLEAYAACWITRIGNLKAIDSTVPSTPVCLEQASYAAFESGIPVAKLSIDHGEAFGDCIVDHLSGYDYNKRVLFKWMYG